MQDGVAAVSRASSSFGHGPPGVSELPAIGPLPNQQLSGANGIRLLRCMGTTAPPRKLRKTLELDGPIVIVFELLPDNWRGVMGAMIEPSKDIVLDKIQRSLQRAETESARLRHRNSRLLGTSILGRPGYNCRRVGRVLGTGPGAWAQRLESHLRSGHHFHGVRHDLFRPQPATRRSGPSCQGHCLCRAPARVGD